MPDDETLDGKPPRYVVHTEFGFMELIPPEPWPADLPELSPEEMAQAAVRYMKKRLGLGDG
jgi:hypothetical protein